MKFFYKHVLWVLSQGICRKSLVEKELQLGEQRFEIFTQIRSHVNEN